MNNSIGYNPVQFRLIPNPEPQMQSHVTIGRSREDLFQLRYPSIQTSTKRTREAYDQELDVKRRKIELGPIEGLEQFPLMITAQSIQFLFDDLMVGILSYAKISGINRRWTFIQVLSDPNMKFLCPSIEAYPNLTKLVIKCNCFPSFEYLNKFKTISLEGLVPAKGIFSRDLNNLTCLNWSVAAYADIELTDEILSKTSNLEVLKVGGSSWPVLCNGAQVSKLWHLDVEVSRRISNVFIEGLSQLEYLRLAYDQPESDRSDCCFSHLTNLHTLTLWNNISITDTCILGLTQLSRLTRLHLGYNNYIQATALQRLNQLKELTIYPLAYDSFDSKHQLKKMTRLEYLAIDIRSIKPQSLICLTNLTSLHFKKRKIQHMPRAGKLDQRYESAILNLKNLKKLTLTEKIVPSENFKRLINNRDGLNFESIDNELSR